MIKKITLAVLLACSSMSYAQTVSPTTGEVQVTGNVIDPNAWNNVIRMNGTQLSQVEGSGGGPVPAYNTDTNTIRFSFMPYTVSQVRAIDQVLSGQGISVSGFNYSWKINNDLLNCCSTRGTLSVTGQLADKSGTVLQSYFYDYSMLNTGPEFLKITGTETFSNPYKLENLGYIGIAWTGKDQNFWSGYYGPRVRDTEITLNYSVTQSSPTSPTVPTTTTTNTSTPTATQVAETFSKPPAESEPQQQVASTSSPPPPPPPGSEPPPPNNAPTTLASTQPPPNGSTQPAPAGSQPPPNSPNNVAALGSAPQASQPAVQLTQQTTQTAQATNVASSPSLASILNTIRNNEKKEQAIAAAAVASANETAQNAVQATEQTALSVALTSSAASMASTSKVEQKITTPVVQTTSSSSQMVSSAPIATTVSSTSVQQTIQLPAQTVQSSSTNSASTMVSNVQAVQPIVQAPQVIARVAPIQTTSNQTINNNITAPLATRPENNLVSSMVQPVIVDTAINVLQAPTIFEAPKPTIQAAIVEIKTMQDNDLTIFSNNFLTNRANPLTEIVENNTRPSSNTVEQKENTLNRNAANNELAGGVQLERMATQPVGYNSYLQLAMRDVAFYAPKEIYRNQRVIDNQQAVRLLNFASDLKHQEMVNLQYGGNK